MVGERKHRLLRVGALGIAGFLASVIAIFVVWRASSNGAKRDRYLHLLHDNRLPLTLDRDTESRIVAFCGDCHATPRAESFPRDRWHYGVKKGYEFYARSGRTDLDPPPLHLTIDYFRSRAPEQPVFPEPEEAETELHASFTLEKLPLDRNAEFLPEISHLRWTRLGPDEDSVLLACDMRIGYVAAVDLRDPRPRLRVLAELDNPCHVEPCDLDGDQAIDLVVADQGGYRPYDHHRGRVVWLRRQDEEDSFEEIVLASGLARAVDVRPADFDADGDLDLIVAEFGWYRAGGIVLLRNVAAPGERPLFERDELDRRPGTIHVPVHDFNHDGRPDFAALVSQEYECVDVFINRGDAPFNQYTLWAGPDLTFGSSGIELVDLDQDGDMDVLYTNGDAWDNNYANPSHGVQWLENRGRLEFAYHRLTDMPGACRALPGDIDLDGDLDIVAVAWLPPDVKPASVAATSLGSILCLEQTEPGVFVRHTLEKGSPYYATLELADFDNDGDLDFAVATGPHVASTRQESYWLAVWWNQVASTRE